MPYGRGRITGYVKKALKREGVPARPGPVIGKPVPILLLGPDGNSRFVTLKWPTATGG